MQNDYFEYKSFIFNSDIAKIAKILMQSKKVNLFHEHVLVKEIGSKKRTPWHQDAAVLSTHGQKFCDMITVWRPFTKTTKNKNNH